MKFVELIAGDIAGKGQITFDDLTFMLSAYGKKGGNLPADLNGDGQVGFEDLSLLISGYGKSNVVVEYGVK